MQDKRKPSKNEPVYPEERKEQHWKALMEKMFPEQKHCEGCICYGTWRNIVAENKNRIGNKFKDKDGKIYEFFGIVYSDDDYYYGLFGDGDLQLLSCCGSIKAYGYKECQ